MQGSSCRLVCSPRLEEGRSIQEFSIVPPSATKFTTRRIVDELNPKVTEVTRLSPQRADRLREFICGHLPPDSSVTVRISPNVQTAAVLPADVDAVVSSDATEIEREQAEALLGDIDTDYLVLITGNEANLDRIPLNDQLTADHAHQFGLAFHELLHILKTAISGIGDLIEASVESTFHEQVHDLVNIIEDGAIEAEAIHGDNFSDNAGVRLELTRRLHSQTPADLSEGECFEYSFWDAVTGYLYERAIFQTGTIDCLLDPNDAKLEFLTEADREAFLTVRDNLDEMVDSALGIRSASRDDSDHRHDKTASLHRARVVIDTWNSAIQPLLEADNEPEQPSNKDRTTDSEVADSSGSEDETMEDSLSGDISSDSSRNDGGLSDPQATDPADEVIENPDIGAITLDRQATEASSQDVFEQPSILPDPNPPTVGDIGDSDTGDRTSDNAEGADTSPDGSTVFESGNVDNTDYPIDVAGNGSEDGTDVPQTKAQAIAQAAERAKEAQQAAGAHQDDRAGDGDGSRESPTNQSTLDTFEADSKEGARDGSHPGVDNGAVNGDKTSRKQLPSEIDAAGVSSAPEIGRGEDEPVENEAVDGLCPEQQTASEIPSGPAHGQQEDWSQKGDVDTLKETLSQDREAAHSEASRNGINEEALKAEFESLADQFSRTTEELKENSSACGGAEGGPGSLDDLSILPVSEAHIQDSEWANVENGAERIGDTLEMYLRLDRRKRIRRGLTSGTYDTRAGHRLAIGDPRVCKSRTLGNEKQYSLVLVLDRSGSMRRGTPAKIDVATKAIARFAVAAEALGINVAIVDFIHNEARLAKPFSIDSRHVQGTLLDTSCGGGTPLADAISLGNQLLETQRDEPLLITITDGLPSDTDDVRVQIRNSIAPVCSLTVATDCTSGSPPDRAKKLAPYFERESVIYSAERLDDRLEQFASLLAGF